MNGLELEKADSQCFLDIVKQSPVIGEILNNWSQVSLPNCWLVAGALAQTVWNDAFGFALDHGLSDVDIVYFDESDLTEESENRHSKRINRLFSQLPVRIDVKNEARVHQWYEDKFGYSIPPYCSVEAAIQTFPTTATAIGIKPENGKLVVRAPFGLKDLLDLVVRPNKQQITRPIYDAKVERWLSNWPKLNVVEWSNVSGVQE